MRAISGILYVKSLIKRAELAKFLFTRDIEYGQQVYIPHELNQDRLPYSFRYYDPILRFVEENIDEDRREFFLLKNQLAYQLYA